VKEAKHGVLLELAYEGTHFHGWAAQKMVVRTPERGEGTHAAPTTRGGAARSLRTVEETLTGAIRALDHGATPPRGTSRTDAGVHADAQLVAFDATLEIPARGWVLALNQHLPEDVAVRRARSVPPGFAPRFANRGKRYRYRVLLDRVRDPHHRTRAWRIGWPVDIDLVEREAQLVLGTHDFAAFRGASDERNDTTRTITRCAIEREEKRVLSIVIEGNAFLYNMVRIIVGTLMEVGRKRLEPGAVARALASKDRRDAGPTAPALGLTLEHVDVILPAEAGEPWPQ
jgi:tRNA pseudouridine38-40 synthase